MLEILCHLKLLSKKIQHKTSLKLLSSKITIQICYLILVLTISSQKRKNKILIALLTLQQVSNRRRIKEVALHLILLPMWLNSNSQCLQFNQKRKYLTFRRMTFRRLVKRNMIWFLLSLTNRIIRAHLWSSLNQCQIHIHQIVRWINLICKVHSQLVLHRILRCQTFLRTWVCLVRCSNNSNHFMALIRILVSIHRLNHNNSKINLVLMHCYLVLGNSNNKDQVHSILV